MTATTIRQLNQLIEISEALSHVSFLAGSCDEEGEALDSLETGYGYDFCTWIAEIGADLSGRIIPLMGGYVVADDPERQTQDRAGGVS